MQICRNFSNISKLILLACQQPRWSVLSAAAAALFPTLARLGLAWLALRYGPTFSNYQRILRKAICIRKMNHHQPIDTR